MAQEKSDFPYIIFHLSAGHWNSRQSQNLSHPSMENDIEK
jgi:hypothetical protein